MADLLALDKKWLLLENESVLAKSEEPLGRQRQRGLGPWQNSAWCIELGSGVGKRQAQRKREKGDASVHWTVADRECSCVW